MNGAASHLALAHSSWGQVRREGGWEGGKEGELRV